MAETPNLKPDAYLLRQHTAKGGTRIMCGEVFMRPDAALAAARRKSNSWRKVEAFPAYAAPVAVPPPLPAWRDIATAPRNGTRILLCRPSASPFIGFWSDWNRWWTDGSVDAARDHVPSYIPTVWAPLPKPPGDLLACSTEDQDDAQ